jgi:hypothetical protein
MMMVMMKRVPRSLRYPVDSGIDVARFFRDTAFNHRDSVEISTSAIPPFHKTKIGQPSKGDIRRV